MAKMKLELGAELDILSRDELDTSLTAHASQWWAARARGEKRMVITGQGQVSSGGTLVIGDYTQGSQRYIGPLEGYAWCVERITVAGWPESGTTPVTATFAAAGSATVTLPAGAPLSGFIVTFGSVTTATPITITVAGTSLGSFTYTDNLVVGGNSPFQSPAFPAPLPAASPSTSITVTVTGSLNTPAGSLAAWTGSNGGGDWLRIFKGDSGADMRSLEVVTFGRPTVYPGRGGVLMPGDHIVVAAGTPYSTVLTSPAGTVWTAIVEALQVPAEQIWKIY